MFQTPEQKLNPYPLYARMRREQPAAYMETARAWCVFRYDDVRTVMGNHAVFSSDNTDIIGGSQNQSIIFSDPPRHTHLRNLVNRAFTSVAVARVEPLIRALTAELLEKALAEGEFDVVNALATPLPVAVIAALLGVPREDQARFKRWSDEHIAAVDPARKGNIDLTYIDEMDAYFARMLQYRRVHPSSDLLTDLLNAEVDGKHLTEKEICSFARVLLVAGNETTTNLIGNAVLSLLEFPEQMALLRVRPELTPAAIEETLRFRSPVVTMPRVCRQAFELGGQLIQPGQRVLPFMASANRDEAKFADADQFQITRDPNPHIAFGHGVHFCLGAPLARLEGQIALGALMAAGEFERADDAPLEPVNGLIAHGVKHLPIRYKRR